jgi:hypothetical protein
MNSHLPNKMRPKTNCTFGGEGVEKTSAKEVLSDSSDALTVNNSERLLPMQTAATPVTAPLGEVKPQRIQLSRKKGWRMPPNTVKVTRGPGMRFGNPFEIGGWFMVGGPEPHARFRMSWCQAASEEIANRTPGKFTLIKDATMAVTFFQRLANAGYFSGAQLASIRGKNLACWCKPGTPCHADVLLELANTEAKEV